MKRTIECPSSRLAIKPTVCAGIEGAVRGRIVNQGGNPIPDLRGFQPPLHFVPEDLLQVDGLFEPECSSFRGQYSVEEQSTCKEDIGCIEQRPCETGEFLL